MKKTIYAEGGRPFYDDDLETIQNEAQVAALSLYAALGGNFIVSGCRVSGSGSSYTIGAGLVYINGELLRFLGATGISLPAALVAGEVTVLDEREYETGGTRTCIQEQFAVVQAGAGAVPLYAAGGLTLQHLLRNAQWELWDVKKGRLETANYDNTGKGIPGTVAWGWALCNGQNGTDDLRQKFIAGYDPEATDYAAVGKTGGSANVILTVAQMPSHNHTDGNKSYIFGPTNGGNDTPQTDKSANEPNIVSPGRLQSAGANEAHENRPPFYVLAFRQWIGF